MDPGTRERASSIAGAVIWQAVATGKAHRVLPDGCMDLIWADDGTLLVSGPDTHAFMTIHPAGTAITGIRLPPGFAPALLRTPAHELRDRREPLTAVMPARAARSLASRLEAAADPADVLEAVAGEVERSVELCGIADSAARGVPVHVIARSLDVSPRQLHRRCLEAFGYGAKTLTRILRLGAALDAVRAGTPAAAAAAEAGYADQAHFARDVKALAGLPMGQLLDEANRSITLPSGSQTAA